MRDYDLGWLTGFYEGEGSAGISGGYPNVGIWSTDLCRLQLVQKLSGMGNIYEAKSRQVATPQHKPIWAWRINKIDECQEFLRLIYDGLSDRRKAQADPIFDLRYAEPPTHCSNGHEYTPENTRTRPGDNARICRTCAREYRRIRRGMDPKTEDGRAKKLTRETVLAIRQAEGSSYMIAKDFGVSPRTIRDIRSRKTWAHV